MATKVPKETRLRAETAAERGWMVQEHVVAFMDESGREALSPGQVHAVAVFAVPKIHEPRLKAHADAIRQIVTRRVPHVHRPKASHLNTHEWERAIDVLNFFGAQVFTDSLTVTQELVPVIEKEASSLAHDLSRLAALLPYADQCDLRVASTLRGIATLAKARPIYFRLVGYVCMQVARLFQRLKLIPQLELVVDRGPTPGGCRENWSDVLGTIQRYVLYAEFHAHGSFTIRDVFGTSRTSFYSCRTSTDTVDAGLFYADCLAYLKRNSVEARNPFQDWEALKNRLAQDAADEEPPLLADT